MSKLIIELDLDNDAFQTEPAEEVYRILNKYVGLIGFLGQIEERPLLDINGNTVGSATVTRFPSKGAA